MEDISGANLNRENGEVRWKFGLEPAGEKSFDLRYSVRYPKDRNLIVE